MSLGIRDVSQGLNRFSGAIDMFKVIVSSKLFCIVETQNNCYLIFIYFFFFLVCVWWVYQAAAFVMYHCLGSHMGNIHIFFCSGSHQLEGKGIILTVKCYCCHLSEHTQFLPVTVSKYFITIHNNSTDSVK